MNISSCSWMVGRSRQVTHVQASNGHGGSSCEVSTCNMCVVAMPNETMTLTAGAHTLKAITSSNDGHYHNDCFFDISFNVEAGSSCSKTPTEIRLCSTQDTSGTCEAVAHNGPHGVNVCDDGQYTMQHTVTSDRRSTANEQQYVCTGKASGGWGVHQAHAHDCTATSPETATNQHMWTNSGHTYSCYFGCSGCV